MEHTPSKKSLSLGLAIALVLVGIPMTVAGSASAQSVNEEYCPDWSGNIIDPCIRAGVEEYNEPLTTEVVIPQQDSSQEMCIAADICINVPEFSLEPEVVDDFKVFVQVTLGDGFEQICEHNNVPWWVCQPGQKIPDVPPGGSGLKPLEMSLADSSGDGAFDGILFETDAGNYYVPLNG